MVIVETTSGDIDVVVVDCATATLEAKPMGKTLTWTKSGFESCAQVLLTYA